MAWPRFALTLSRTRGMVAAAGDEGTRAGLAHAPPTGTPACSSLVNATVLD